MLKEQIKKKISVYEEYFNSKCSEGRIITYDNGFTAVGIFDEPEEHLNHHNDVWVYCIGFNEDASDVEEIINASLTMGETRDLMKCLEYWIKKTKMKKFKGAE